MYILNIHTQVRADDGSSVEVLSTGDVAHRIIIPLTRRSRMTYVDQFLYLDGGMEYESPWLSDATHLVSHRLVDNVSWMWNYYF